MPDSERVELRFGPYPVPEFQYGDIVQDVRRGDVTIVGLSDSPLPWPIGKIGRARGLVLFGSLIDAVHDESCAAICHWWGTSTTTVTKWRHALDVEQFTKATRILKGYASGLGDVWTDTDDMIVRELSPQEAATKTGRTVIAIYGRRRKLGLNVWAK